MRQRALLCSRIRVDSVKMPFTYISSIVCAAAARPFYGAGIDSPRPVKGRLTAGPDAVPRVILLGRLAVYGPKAARLHEEIVSSHGKVG